MAFLGALIGAGIGGAAGVAIGSEAERRRQAEQTIARTEPRSSSADYVADDLQVIARTNRALVAVVHESKPASLAVVRLRANELFSLPASFGNNAAVFGRLFTGSITAFDSARASRSLRSGDAFFAASDTDLTLRADAESELYVLACVPRSAERRTVPQSRAAVDLFEQTALLPKVTVLPGELLSNNGGFAFAAAGTLAIESQTERNRFYRSVVATPPGRDLQVALMRVRPNQTVPGDGMDEVHEGSAQFTFVEAGSGALRLNGRVHDLAANSAFVVAPGSRHLITAGDAGMALYVVYCPAVHAAGLVDEYESSGE